MSRLMPTDYARLLDVVGEMHVLPDLDSLRIWLLEAGLPRLVAADWFSYNEVDLRTPALVALMRPDEQIVARYGPAWTAHMHEHPLVHNDPPPNPRSVEKISDYLARPAFHDLGIYQEVYRHLEVEHQISLSLDTGPHHVTAVAISRKLRDFTERDRRLLQAFQAHVGAAFQTRLALHSAVRLQVESAQALQALNAFAMLCDSRGRILRADAAAHQILMSYFDVLAQDRLPEDVLRWWQRHDDLEAPAPFVRQGPRGTLALRVVRLDGSRQCMLVGQEHGLPDHTAAVRELGLSRRECEVVQWLMEGRTNQGIAAVLGISARTVQKHLERIFTKCGVSTRAGVIARVYERFGTATGGAGR